MFKNFLKMNAGDFSLYAAITGGLFLLGEVVILCVMAFMKPDTSIFLAGIVLPIVGAFSLFLMSFTNSTVMFDTALRFGRTRRQSLGLVAGLLALEGVFVMGLAAVLALAERFLLPGLWAKLAGFEGWKLGLNMPVPEGSQPVQTALLQIEDFVLAWWWYPLLWAAALALGLAFGALIQRFGPKGAGVLWCLWMGLCFGPQLFGANMYFIGQWSVGLIAGVAVLVLAGLVWAVWSLLHAVVRW